MEKGPHIHTAVFNGKYFEHFGIREISAFLYGKKKEEILKVELTISDDQSLPPLPQNDPAVMTSDYWGWWDNEQKHFSMIYQKRFLLNMCFPYGIESSEEKGKGKAYRLEVKEIK